MMGAGQASCLVQTHYAAQTPKCASELSAATAGDQSSLLLDT